MHLPMAFHLKVNDVSRRPFFLRVEVARLSFRSPARLSCCLRRSSKRLSMRDLNGSRNSFPPGVAARLLESLCHFNAVKSGLQESPKSIASSVMVSIWDSPTPKRMQVGFNGDFDPGSERLLMPDRKPS